MNPLLQILKQTGQNTGILYEYSIPNEVRAGSRHTYDWVPADWSECSRSCGQGEVFIVTDKNTKLVA